MRPTEKATIRHLTKTPNRGIKASSHIPGPSSFFRGAERIVCDEYISLPARNLGRIKSCMCVSSGAWLHEGPGLIVESF